MAAETQWQRRLDERRSEEESRYEQERDKGEGWKMRTTMSSAATATTNSANRRDPKSAHHMGSRFACALRALLYSSIASTFYDTQIFVGFATSWTIPGHLPVFLLGTTSSASADVFRTVRCLTSRVSRAWRCPNVLQCGLDIGPKWTGPTSTIDLLRIGAPWV